MVEVPVNGTAVEGGGEVDEEYDEVEDWDGNRNSTSWDMSGNGTDITNRPQITLTAAGNR